MQARDQQRLIKMFEWREGPRLMTVIRGFPMYRSTGINSGFKNTWFPHLGIDGAHWIRKPCLCLPKEIIQFCKQISLDKKISLSRFGNIQTACISASIGDGLWITKEGMEFKKYLLDKFDIYFLSIETKEKIHELQKLNTHNKTHNIAIANTYLEQYGSWIPVNYSSRLPSDIEYLFFILAGNCKIRSALSMMLSSKKCITVSNFNMVCKLFENENLLNYALQTGLLEVRQNICFLTKRLVKNNTSIELNDLIQSNSLHYLSLPFKYKNLQKKFSCRKILRKIPACFLREHDFDLMKILDDLHLLDRYSVLITNATARLGLYFLYKNLQINYKTIKKLYQTFKDGKLDKYYIPLLELEYLSNHLHDNTNLLKYYSLFARSDQSTSRYGNCAKVPRMSINPHQ